MTPKQKERLVNSAVKKLRAAADALSDLSFMSVDYGVKTDIEDRFTADLRERANYWESCTWWKKEA